MADMTMEQLIDEIEVYIDNCKTAGVLSGGSMIKVNREELLAMLEELHAQLPRELAEARQVLRTKEAIIADAKSKADRIVKEAAKEAGTMIESHEIVNMANIRADEILGTAQKEADDLTGTSRENARAVQTGALQYAQNMLEGLEYMYSSIISQEQDYFEAVIDKLREQHSQILADKQEIDMQLGAGGRMTRSREQFEKKGETAEGQENNE